MSLLGVLEERMFFILRILEAIKCQGVRKKLGCRLQKKDHWD